MSCSHQCLCHSCGPALATATAERDAARIEATNARHATEEALQDLRVAKAEAFAEATRAAGIERERDELRAMVDALWDTEAAAERLGQLFVDHPGNAHYPRAMDSRRRIARAVLAPLLKETANEAR